jgi:UDP-N-acetylmuramoyl-tripeptide--D-alanyl-D-alanine ligase
MTPLWTSAAVAEATAGKASAEFDITGVAYDSREVGPGDLFVALKGEATDGHKFLDGAYAAGAAGAIVDRDVSQPHVLVKDTAAALGALGVAARARTAAQVVGVTGSVGKTGTKEALFAAFDRIAPGRAHRSVKSYNNHVGVPLSLSRMPADTRFAALEMGMNHEGELAALTRLVRPHVAIVTAIAPAHRAHFPSEEAIADAKGEIFQGLELGGTAIIPFDSPHRERLIAAAKPYAERIWTFGSGVGADVRAVDTATAKNGGTTVTMTLPGGGLTFTVAQPGAHWVSNALAVLAAVEAVGGDLAVAGLALAGLGGIEGRGARHEVPVGAGSATIIDESYNANPASMAATLAVLGAQPATRRIAVLGAMRELGEESERLHAALVEPVTAASVDLALLIGDEMAPLAKALEGRVKIVKATDAAAALAILQDELQPGDAVLIKGSNAIGLARIVKALAGELA